MGIRRGLRFGLLRSPCKGTPGKVQSESEREQGKGGETQSPDCADQDAPVDRHPRDRTMHIWVSWLRDTSVQLVTAPATCLPPLASSSFTIRSSAAGRQVEECRLGNRRPEIGSSREGPPPPPCITQCTLCRAAQEARRFGARRGDGAGHAPAVALNSLMLGAARTLDSSVEVSSAACFTTTMFPCNMLDGGHVVCKGRRRRRRRPGGPNGVARSQAGPLPCNGKPLSRKPAPYEYRGHSTPRHHKAR